MDRRGSAVTTISHRTHSKMKELFVKLHGKRGDCLASGFVSELLGAVYPKIPEINMGLLDGRETKRFYHKIRRHSPTAFDRS